MVETYQVLQYVTIALTGVVMLVCTLLPWRIKKYKNAALIMSVGSCFGSGVILGAAFSHMTPDAMESFEEYFGHDNESTVAKYPWPMLIAMMMLLILISADVVANGAHDKMMGHEHGHDHGEGGHQNHLVALFTDKPEKKSDNKEKYEEKSEKCEKEHDHTHNHKGPKVDTECQVMQTEVVATQGDQLVKAVKPQPLDLEQPESAAGSKKQDESENSDKPKRGTKSQVIQAYVFFIALSIHSISDGMSVGAENDSNGFYGIAIAVIAHKALDGFALGVPLYYANLPKFHTIFAIIFCSLMTPLGVGIGIAATQSLQSEKAGLASGIVLSISMGSFIFISLWEMLPAGLNQGKWTGLKIIATFLGWGLMAILAAFVQLLNFIASNIEDAKLVRNTNLYVCVLIVLNIYMSRDASQFIRKSYMF